MVPHGIYAQIHNGKVQNVMICDEYTLANEIARMSYGEDAFAIDVEQYPVAIGDEYRDGFFYRTLEDGSEIQIEYVPTERQAIVALEDQNTFLETALVEQYEENLALQESVTTTQLALTELYEMGVE